MENKAWKYISKEIRRVFWKGINKIWKKGEIPEEWNKEVIRAKFTKWHSLQNICEYPKWKEASEGKLQKEQFGFRTEGTINAIYGLNFVVRK